MEDGSRRTALVIGAVAAAAGVAIGSYILIWRMRAARQRPGVPLRTVSEILTDCYTKMRDIQSRLTELNAATFQPSPTKS